MSGFLGDKTRATQPVTFQFSFSDQRYTFFFELRQNNKKISQKISHFWISWVHGTAIFWVCSQQGSSGTTLLRLGPQLMSFFNMSFFNWKLKAKQNGRSTNQHSYICSLNYLGHKTTWTVRTSLAAQTPDLLRRRWPRANLLVLGLCQLFT